MSRLDPTWEDFGAVYPAVRDWYVAEHGAMPDGPVSLSAFTSVMMAWHKATGRPLTDLVPRVCQNCHGTGMLAEQMPVKCPHCTGGMVPVV